MDLGQARALFEVTERYAYLNHASVAALPRPVVDTMARYLDSRAASGSEALIDWEAHIIEHVRQQLAGFLGAHRDEIAFTSSVSHGLNIVAAGIEWQPGDNVVCAETEFPANVYPWTNLRRRGVEVRLVPARDNRILPDDVEDAVDARTRLVAVSFVEFASGYRNDLDALAGICHARGAYLCVDGIQGLGALRFSVRESPVDMLAGHAAKWMLGPIGAGFLYVRRELLDALDPVMTGWRSVVDREAYFSYNSPLRETAERFEPGSPNVAGLMGLGAAVELLLAVGLETIEARILQLTDHLIDRLRAQGCTIVSPVSHRGERSGIVSFRHPALDSAALAQRLHAARVIVSVRGDAIRVSPHFYNTEEDLERLLQHSRAT